LRYHRDACDLGGTTVGFDLTDRAARQSVFAEIESRARYVLVLTEGAVPYPDVQEAATLADDLRARPAFRRWIVDYFSPEIHKFRDRPAIKRGMPNAPWRFQPRDYDEFSYRMGGSGKRRDTSPSRRSG